MKRTEGDAGKIQDQPVKEITESAGTVPGKASVKAALNEIDAQGTDSCAVTDEGGKLLGTVSKDGMNRKVGGLGHDPKTSPVEPQIKKDSAFCFEDQTVGEAEQVMRDSKVDELSVVNRDKVLVGKANLGAIARKNEEG